MGKAIKRAGFTFWRRSAKFFSETNEKSVIFIEELHVRGEIRFEKFLNLVIIGVFINQVMKGADTFCIGVDNEDGAVEGVKED